MDHNWNYKIDLSSQEVFSEIEAERGIKIPYELKNLIVEANAATPERYHFMIGNVEKVFGAMLSFNKGEVDTDSADTAFSVIEDQNLFPFGIDPFGNYICYDLEKNVVVFWDHENGKVSSSEMGLMPFFRSLY